jgi:hypothetical protein
MDDFETFKATREKMDPSSRKMSDHQWKQAHIAYCSARERVAGGSTSKEAKSSKRRRSKNTASVRGAHSPSNVSELGQLRQVVRNQSAYADLRLIVDILAWIAIGVVVLAAMVTLFYYTSVPAAIASLLAAAVQVIGIVLMRLLVAVLIDIPDIALYRSLRDPSPRRDPDAGYS